MWRDCAKVWLQGNDIWETPKAHRGRRVFLYRTLYREWTHWHKKFSIFILPATSQVFYLRNSFSYASNVKEIFFKFQNRANRSWTDFGPILNHRHIFVNFFTPPPLDCHQPPFGWITNDCLGTAFIMLHRRWRHETKYGIYWISLYQIFNNFERNILIAIDFPCKLLVLNRVT
jgi:hypothetical protein